MDPKTATRVQRVSHGLKILESYLSRDNPGGISAEHDVIYMQGIPDEALGRDDKKMLGDLGWRWDEDVEAWRIYV